MCKITLAIALQHRVSLKWHPIPYIVHYFEPRGLVHYYEPRGLWSVSRLKGVKDLKCFFGNKHIFPLF